MQRTGEGSGSQQQLSLVLLPGSLCDERIFAPLVERLPGVPTQVIVCLHAESMEQAADFVLAQAPQRFALLGFSLGGMIAMHIAAQAPDRVAGLALVSTSPLPVSSIHHDVRRQTAALAATMPMDAYVRTHLWPGYCGCAESADAQDTALALMQSMALRLGPAVMRRQTEMALSRPDYRPRLTAVRCPTLIVAGQHDRLCPPEAQQALHRALPQSTLCMLADAGHLAVVEQPAEVARAVAAWFHTVLHLQETTLVETAPTSGE